VRLLHKLGACIMVAGFLIVMAGGMSVRRDPTGTWVQVNLVHVVGGGMLLCGVVLAVIAAFASGASAKADKGRVVDSEATR